MASAGRVCCEWTNLVVICSAKLAFSLNIGKICLLPGDIVDVLPMPPVPPVLAGGDVLPLSVPPEAGAVVGIGFEELSA